MELQGRCRILAAPSAAAFQARQSLQPAILLRLKGLGCLGEFVLEAGGRQHMLLVGRSCAICRERTTPSHRL